MDLLFHPNCIQQFAFYFRYKHDEKFGKKWGEKGEKMIVDDTM